MRFVDGGKAAFASSGSVVYAIIPCGSGFRPIAFDWAQQECRHLSDGALTQRDAETMCEMDSANAEPIKAFDFLEKPLTVAEFERLRREFGDGYDWAATIAEAEQFQRGKSPKQRNKTGLGTLRTWLKRGGAAKSSKDIGEDVQDAIHVFRHCWLASRFDEGNLTRSLARAVKRRDWVGDRLRATLDKWSRFYAAGEQQFWPSASRFVDSGKWLLDPPRNRDSARAGRNATVAQRQMIVVDEGSWTEVSEEDQRLFDLALEIANLHGTPEYEERMRDVEKGSDLEVAVLGFVGA